MITYSSYPSSVVNDIVRLRRRIAASGLPEKVSDTNLLIGTWNIRAFGNTYESWSENPGSPKRNWHALACIAEIVRRLDVVAIQEVKRDTSGIRTLVNEFLGPDWGLILSDVTAGASGNTERFAFVFDKRRVQPSGLAGEIVLPPTLLGNPEDQFDRSPYLVGFQTNTIRFTLLTAHIKYGNIPKDRVPEIKALAEYVAHEINARATQPSSEETNLIVLGDFNIESRSDNPLFNAFVATGLVIPPQLLDVKSTFDLEPKHYDQIGWFMHQNFGLRYNNKAGSINFAEAIFKQLSLLKMSFRVSDHFPLWVEFGIDHSEELMGRTLGLSDFQIAMPDPLSFVPD